MATTDRTGLILKSFGIPLAVVIGTNVALNKVLNPGLSNTQLGIAVALSIATLPISIGVMAMSHIDGGGKPTVTEKAVGSAVGGTIYALPMMLVQPTTILNNVGVGVASHFAVNLFIEQ